MKRLFLSAALLLLAMTVAAQGPPAVSNSKILAPQSIIVATVNGLNCSTSAGTNTFPVQAWSWGASNTADTSSGGGGGTGKATVHDLTVQKKFDGCSPALFGAVVSGKHFNGMTLTQEDSNHNIVLTLTLTDVLVTSWNIGGAQSSELPVESVSFAFRKVCIQEPSTSSKFCYDLSTAGSF